MKGLRLLRLVWCCLLGWALLCSTSLTMVYAQETKTLEGVVVDPNDHPLLGVVIMVKGTSNGAHSSLDGSFKLNNVKVGATLTFSYLGYAPHSVVWHGESPLRVVLKEDVELLDEVVVTAVGIKQMKRKIGYSTQQIKSDVLEQQSTLNVGSSLSGQVAGLRVTNPTGLFQSPEITIRGQRPLIVVDGMPMESDLFDINGNNIESINVLKGTSASALYGSRGKNGAVIITTKSGGEEGLQVTAQLSSMISAGYTVFPKTQNEYGSGSQGQYEFWDGADGGISDGDMTWGPKFQPGLLVKQWNSPIRDKQTGEVIPWWGDVAGSKYDDRNRYERVPTPFVQHDNLSDYLRTGVISQASFALQSTGKCSSTYAAVNFSLQRGRVPNTSMMNGGAMLNYTAKITDDINFSLNTSYSKVYSPNYPRYGYGPRNYVYTILLWMSDDVNGKELREHLYRPDAEGYRQANYNYAWYNNPYFMAYEATQLHDRNVLNGMTTLSWTPLEELSLRGRFGARIDNRLEDRKVPKSYMNYGDSREGDYKIWNTHNLDVNADFLASYTNRFISDKVGVEANVGASTFFKSYDQQYQSTDGLIVPKVYAMGNSAGPVMANTYISKKAINSIYASVGFDYNYHTFLTFTGRNDWSSTLPKSHSSYFYPSISFSSILSDYIEMGDRIDFVKLYTSWATVSNDLSPYQLAPVYENGKMYNGKPSVTYPHTLVNPLIEPEKTTSYEIGLSGSFLKNGIAVELTYFRSIDENQIVELPISDASGFTSRMVNGNVYTTNGFEVMLTATPFKQKDFTWELHLNFSGKAKILTEIYDNQERYGYMKVGDRADAIYARKWMHSAEGKLILSSHGMPIRDSYRYNVGNSLPDYMLGFQNTFHLYGFRINIDFDGAIGGTLISNTHQKMWWAGKHPKSTTWRDAEYAAGKPIYVPEGVVQTGGELKRDIHGNVLSDSRTYKPNTTAVSWQSWAQNYPYRAVVTTEESKEFANTFDMSFLKLRRVAISYDINRLTKWDSISGLELSLFGNNLFVLKNVPYLDPDFGSSDDGLQDPSSRYIGMSATLKF